MVWRVSVLGDFLHDVETFRELGLDFALLDLEYFFLLLDFSFKVFFGNVSR